MSKLLTQSEHYAEFLRLESENPSVPGIPFCSPPAVKTESIQGLAALVDSGQAGGNPPLKLVNTFGHLYSPVGGWFQICGGRCFTLLAAYRKVHIAQARSA